MRDIVERLREACQLFAGGKVRYDAMTDAADEITRLRAEVEAARDAVRAYAKSIAHLERVQEEIAKSLHIIARRPYCDPGVLACALQLDDAVRKGKG